MIGIIAAVSVNGVIGVDGKIPWNYPEDMKHFRKTTADSVVIMGRKTFESIGRPLPKRRNIVIANVNFVAPEGVEAAPTFARAMAKTINENKRDIWLIGGASVYEMGLQCADRIILTLVPDHIDTSGPHVIRFPWIDPSRFHLESIVPISIENMTNNLRVVTYEKITR